MGSAPAGPSPATRPSPPSIPPWRRGCSTATSPAAAMMQPSCSGGGRPDREGQETQIMTWAIVTMPIETESDVVAVRQQAQRLAELLGVERQDQTRLATAVSEIARNAFVYAKRGRAEFMLDPTETPPLL